MATDRAIIKERQVGQAQAYGLASSATTAVANIHTRAYIGPKIGAENAETNVAETSLFVVNRAGQVKSVKYANTTTVAENATDCVYIVVSKSTAGATSVPIATWNTGAAAEGGALTSKVAASFIVSPNSDATVAAGDVITYSKTGTLTGGILDGAAFVVDIEES